MIVSKNFCGNLGSTILSTEGCSNEGVDCQDLARIFPGSMGKTSIFAAEGSEAPMKMSLWQPRSVKDLIRFDKCELMIVDGPYLHNVHKTCVSLHKLVQEPDDTCFFLR